MQNNSLPAVSEEDVTAIMQKFNSHFSETQKAAALYARALSAARDRARDRRESVRALLAACELPQGKRATAEEKETNMRQAYANVRAPARR